MKVAEYIVQELVKVGVCDVFGYQGGNITYVIDEISAKNGIRFIQTYHEQGAAFAANGYAQSNKNLGVAVVSSGPGALNLVTGVANAYFDSVPTLFISGDLSRRYEKNGLPLRQDGFQSTDIVSIVKSITKYAVQVTSPEDIRYCLERAIYEAMTGRRGAVYLSIPHWIQKAEITPDSLMGFLPQKNAETFFENGLANRVKELIKNSHRPLFLLGGGICGSEMKNSLNKVLSLNPIPVVVSLCGLNALSHDHPSYVGFIGDYGHRHANIALAASDCLIVLGSRLDERQIGILDGYLANKKILHFDIDPSELLQESESYIPINSSAQNCLDYIQSISSDELDHFDWIENLTQLQIKYPVLPSDKDFRVTKFLRTFSEHLLSGAQIFVDVGVHQMASAQGLYLDDDKKIFFSGGLGSMGYALPACIGGNIASLKKQTVCISGDGGFMMNSQELQLIAREKLNIKIVVINNNCLGMIRELQKKLFDGRAVGSEFGYQVCDLKKTAAVFGLRYIRIACSDDQRLLKYALNDSDPVLIEVVFPLDMEPFPAGFNYSLNDDVNSLINANGSK